MNAGRITGSFVNIGASISENLLGGIDKYLSANKDFIKIRLSEMFDARAVLWNKIGDFQSSFHKYLKYSEAMQHREYLLI